MDTNNIPGNLKNSIFQAIDELKGRGLLIASPRTEAADYYCHFAQNIISAFRYADMLGAKELVEMMMSDSPLIAEWYKTLIVRDRTLTDSAAMLAGVLMECVNEPAEAHRVIHHFTS
jgi:hypothetical protein